MQVSAGKGLGAVEVKVLEMMENFELLLNLKTVQIEEQIGYYFYFQEKM
mgnify:CR=1 FL=1